MSDTDLQPFRDVVGAILKGPVPGGLDFDACRELLGRERSGDTAFQALCMLLEGALADASLDIESTQVLVRLLKKLARGDLRPEEVIP